MDMFSFISIFCNVVMLLIQYRIILKLALYQKRHNYFSLQWKKMIMAVTQCLFIRLVLFTSVVQFSSVAQSCPILCDPVNRSTPGLPVHHQLLSTQTHVHWVGGAIQPSHPLSSPFPPAPNLSQHQGLFQWVNSLHEVASWNWSFSFSISPSSEHPGLISFRMDWLDLLAVQQTLKGLLQYNSSKASILRHSASFIVQLSHPYKNTGKTIALTGRTFVDKVMSLLFNMLSRLVITFQAVSIF